MSGIRRRAAGCLRQPEQQERVRRITEGEDGHHCRVGEERARETHLRCGNGLPLDVNHTVLMRRNRRQREIGVHIPHAPHECHRDRAGNRGQQEQGAVAAGGGQQEYRGGERADHRPGVVHRAMEAVDAPAVARFGPVRKQSVARRAAHALADAVREPDGEHRPPATHERDERPRRRRKRVTRNHQPAAGARAIGQPAGNDAQQAVGALRNAFNQSERYRSAAEHRREEEREQRVDGFRRGIREQAHPPEQPDRRWKRAPHHAAQCTSRVWTRARHPSPHVLRPARWLLCRARGPCNQYDAPAPNAEAGVRSR